MAHHRFSSEEIDFFREQLLSFYTTNKRDLPWRNLATTIEDTSQRAYSIWVSEIMLQQTQVATVIEYYNKWMRRWPTVLDLSKATLQEVNEMWSGLGYYSRGRRLHEGAQKLSKVRGKKCGVMPQTARELMKELCGVGRYTAGAIASIAYNQVTGVVDGNVIRVLSRVRMIGAPTPLQTTMELFWELANKIVDPEQPGDFNQALMELGAKICTPTSPKCFECPIMRICKAHRRQCESSKGIRKITDTFKSDEAPIGGQDCFDFDTDNDGHENNGDKTNKQTKVDSDKGDIVFEIVDSNDNGGKSSTEGSYSPEVFVLGDIEDFPECKFCLPSDEPWESKLGVTNYPRKGIRKPPGAENFISLVIEHDNKYLFSQRPDKGLLASMWEFPLTQIERERKESIEIDVINTEMKRRFGIRDFDNLRYCGDVGHVFSHKFHVYRVYKAMLSELPEEVVEDSDGRAVRWLSEDEANKAAITSAIRKIMAVKDCGIKTKGKRKRPSETKLPKGQKTLDNILTTKKTKN